MLSSRPRTASHRGEVYFERNPYPVKTQKILGIVNFLCLVLTTTKNFSTKTQLFFCVLIRFGFYTKMQFRTSFRISKKLH